MKKLLLFTLIGWFAIQFVNAGDRVTQDLQSIPDKARSFIQQHFPDVKISYIKIDGDLFDKKKYEVVLTDGTDIDFDKNGEWLEIDAKRNRIPTSVLPTAVATYLKSNFPDNFVTQIEKKRKGYEVELNSDLSLEFNANGRLVKMDD